MKIVLIVLASIYLFAGLVFALFRLYLDMLETSWKAGFLAVLRFVWRMMMWLLIIVKSLIDSRD